MRWVVSSAVVLVACLACSEQGTVGSPGSSASRGAASNSATSAGAASASTTGAGPGSSSGARSTSGSSSNSGAATSGGGNSSSGASGASASSGTTGAADAGPLLGCDCRRPPCGCGGPVPLCEADSGVCIECRSSSDCAGKPLAYCGPSGACVACATDGDCRAPRGRCDAAGSCVACLQDADCARWAPEAGRCETDPGNLNFGACVPCTAKSPTCAAAQASADVSQSPPLPAPSCDTVRDLCSVANPLSPGVLTCETSSGQCAVDNDCQAACLNLSGFTAPHGLSCFGGVCAQCHSDSNCAGTVGSSGQPTPRCALDPASPAFTSCVQCARQADCNLSDGDLCLPALGVCELDCRTDAGAGTCGYGVDGELAGLNDCDPKTGFCVACLRDAECPGSGCDQVKHVCRAAGAAGPCLSTTQCTPGQVCVYQPNANQLWGSLAQAASQTTVFGGAADVGTCSCAADVDCGDGGLTCQGSAGGLTGTCQ